MHKQGQSSSRSIGTEFEAAGTQLERRTGEAHDKVLGTRQWTGFPYSLSLLPAPLATQPGPPRLCLGQVVQRLLDMRREARPQVQAAHEQGLHHALHLRARTASAPARPLVKNASARPPHSQLTEQKLRVIT